MTRTKHGSKIAAVTVLQLLAAGCAGDVEPADMVLVGGPVVTLTSEGTERGIAVTGERIVAMGSRKNPT